MPHWNGRCAGAALSAGAGQLVMEAVMTFSIRNLSVLAYANGFTLWHYKACCPRGATAPGFFDPAIDMLASGDIMLVSSPAGAQVLCVAASDGSVVAAPLG